MSYSDIRPTRVVLRVNGTEYFEQPEMRREAKLEAHIRELESQGVGIYLHRFEALIDGVWVTV